MSAIEVEIKCRELRRLQSIIEEARKEVEAIKDSLKAHMGDTEELRAGEYKVTWKTVTTCDLDTVALKKALPDLVRQFTKVRTTRRFFVA